MYVPLFHCYLLYSKGFEVGSNYFYPSLLFQRKRLLHTDISSSFFLREQEGAHTEILLKLEKAVLRTNK
jgi:hypothetical protein